MEQGNWPVSIQIPDAPASTSSADWPRGMVTVMRAAMAHNRGDDRRARRGVGAGPRAVRAHGDLWGLALSKQMRAEWLDPRRAARARPSAQRRVDRDHAPHHLDLGSAAAAGLVDRDPGAARPHRRGDRPRRVAARVGEGRSDRRAPSCSARPRSRCCTSRWATPTPPNRTSPTLDAAIAEWPGVPLQLVSMADRSAARGWRALRGDLDAARATCCARAAEAAVASGDHPIMAMVALGVGALAARRGDLDDAAPRPRPGGRTCGERPIRTIPPRRRLRDCARPDGDEPRLRAGERGDGARPGRGRGRPGSDLAAVGPGREREEDPDEHDAATPATQRISPPSVVPGAMYRRRRRAARASPRSRGSPG